MGGAATSDRRTATATMKGQVLDDFTDLSGWSPVASGQAQLDISQDRGPRGGALRLDFDFKGGAGFVVARKRFSFPLPEAYAFTFDVHGVAPANKLEFKLIDPSGHNVWRYQEDGFGFPAEWRSLRIRSSQIDFAWGPAGSGPMRQVGAIEFAIAAPPGGKGTVWIANLCLEDHSVRSTPAVQASSSLPGHEPRCAVDRCVETSWRSEPSDEPQWFLVDFGEAREYGGLIVRWDPTTTARPFDLESSDDGTAWKTLYSARRPGAARSYVYLPHGTSRRLRLRLHQGVDGKGIGIAEIDVRPYEFSRSLNAFFQSIAANEPRGLFPRYLCGEQTYWTPMGSAIGGVTQGLLNEDGMLEVDRGTFSIEPFLHVGEALVTWADGSPTQELEQGFLPIPSSVWRKDGIVLRATAFATGEAGKAVLYVRYRLENLEAEPRHVRFFAALRPFQVTPPWQAFHDLGGVSAITTLEHATGAVWVNRRKAVIPLTAPSGFGAAAFEQGAVTEYLLSGDLPREGAVSDGFGYASGALRYDLRWYARHQAPDGTVPCCVDRNGPDWLAEYDSQGELIYAVMEHFRFTGDRAFLAEMWPAVTCSVDRIEALRSQRLTAEFQRPEKRACYGLLPESVSHEGYLAHPVHAYWDDFWALRGLKDAAVMANILADGPQALRLAALRDSFRETLHASIMATMTDRRIDYVPASVEWADIDPAATANAIALVDEAQALPAAAIDRTFA